MLHAGRAQQRQGRIHYFACHSRDHRQHHICIHCIFIEELPSWIKNNSLSLTQPSDHSTIPDPDTWLGQYMESIKNTNEHQKFKRTSSATSILTEYRVSVSPAQSGLYFSAVWVTASTLIRFLARQGFVEGAKHLGLVCHDWHDKLPKLVIKVNWNEQQRLH